MNGEHKYGVYPYDRLGYPTCGGYWWLEIGPVLSGIMWRGLVVVSPVVSKDKEDKEFGWREDWREDKEFSWGFVDSPPPKTISGNYYFTGPVM